MWNNDNDSLNYYYPNQNYNEEPDLKVLNDLKDIDLDLEFIKTFNTSNKNEFEKKLQNNENSMNKHQIQNSEIKNKSNEKFKIPTFIVHKDENIECKHSKGSSDNIIQKIRRYTIKFGQDLINDCIKKEYGFQKFKIKTVDKNITSNMRTDYNREFMEKTLESIYSGPLNDRYKKPPKDENKRKIEKIRNNKQKIVINKLLSMKFKDLYKMYINKNKKNLEEYGSNAQNFYDLIKKEKDLSYISKLIEEKDRFFEFFLNRSPRKPKKKYCEN